MLKAYRRLSLVSQISIIILSSIAIGFLIIILMINNRTQAAFHAKNIEGFTNNLGLISRLLAESNQALTDNARRMGAVFVNLFPVRPLLDPARTLKVGEVDTPILTSDGEIMNLNTYYVDMFKKITGNLAAVSVRMGDDFVRVATTFPDEEGQPALGTSFGAGHPALALLLAGQPYTGRTVLFGRPYMIHDQPIIDARGEVIGVFSIGIDIADEVERMRASLSDIRFGKHGFIAIAEGAGPNKGVALLHPKLEGKKIDALPGYASVFTSDQGVIETRDTHHPELGSMSIGWTAVPGRSIKLIAVSYEKDTLKTALELRTLLTVLAVIIAMLLAALIILLLRGELKPLRALGLAMQQMAEGRLGLPQELITRAHRDPPSTHNEITRLIQHTVQMAEGLRGLIKELERSGQELFQAASAVREVNQRMSAVAQSQHQQTEQVAAAVHEMAATAQHVAEQAEGTLEATRTADDEVAHGHSLMQQTLQSIHALESSLDQTSHAIHEAFEESKNIDKVLSVIQQITEQTNLLALNAAIEAARAGEQGRGFGVVADEVRLLAQRTQSSTEEIRGLIQRLQGRTKAAVQAMEGGMQLTGQSVQDANEAGLALEAILQAVGRVNENVQLIASAAQEQSQVSEDINRNVSEIQAGARQTEEAATNTLGEGERLVGIANRLRQNLDRFRLG